MTQYGYPPLENRIARCREIAEDIALSTVREYKERTRGMVLGYFPVYSPVEIYQAAGYLPVGLNGGGNRLEITAADSRFGSFICSIVKSTTEMALKGNLQPLDGMVFHSICDSARNLAFVLQRGFPKEVFMEYIHLPQNVDRPAAIEFLQSEYQGLFERISQRAESRPCIEKLKESIRLHNRNRSLLRSLYLFREKRPQDLPTWELYVLMRAGNFIPVEEHNRILEESLGDLEKRSQKAKDNIRVVVEGSFCEQPPLELLKILDEAGCYVVEDDFLIGRRWFQKEIPLNGDPLLSLAQAYLKQPVASSVKHLPADRRTAALLEKVRRTRARAVLFLSAKFCEPALFDYVPYKKALEKENIPHLLIEFEEKMWTFEKTRMELETLVESLLFD